MALYIVSKTVLSLTASPIVVTRKHTRLAYKARTMFRDMHSVSKFDNGINDLIGKSQDRSQVAIYTELLRIDRHRVEVVESHLYNPGKNIHITTVGDQWSFRRSNDEIDTITIKKKSEQK